MRGQGRVYRPKYNGVEARVWWLDYSVRGHRHRETSHTTSKTQALRLLRERIGDRESGKLIANPDRVTLRDLGSGLERHYQREGNRSLQRAQQAFEHLERFFQADARALDITKQRVGEYVEHRLGEGAARGTVRYEVAVLNAGFSVAVEDELLTVRPMFKLPAVRNARSGFFEDGDFAALLVELPDYLRPAIRFARMTGWRKSEVLGLTWDQVDWEGTVMRLSATQTKGGDARVFPFGLAPGLKELLEEQWKRRDGLFVFHREGHPIKSFRTPGSWRAAARASTGGSCMTSGARRRATSGAMVSRRGRS